MIYLDNSATTPVCPEAAEKMLEAATAVWGNPSSLHNVGLDAEHFLSAARQSVLDSLGAPKREGMLVFTGSGTEANNLAIFGTAWAKNRAVKRIITDDSQHASVMMPLARLEEQGIEIIRIPTAGGKLDIDALKAAVNEDTVLVTLMMTNNETGALYDVAQAFRAVKKINPNTVTHTDAIQAFHKIPFTVSSCGAELISISGHKVRAPKGIGALYISQNVIKSKRIVPYILGGGQENGFRSGTENVPAAAAFGEAVKRPFNYENALARREQLITSLPDGVRANIPAKYVPHIISLTLPDIKSETMLHYLSGEGICVSSGSACSSHGHSGPGPLGAFGLTAHEADCTIRVSLGGDETEAQIAEFIDKLGAGCRKLVTFR